MYDGLGGAERVSRLSVVRRVDRLVVVRIDCLVARVGRLGVVRVACLGVTGVNRLVARFGLLVTAFFDSAIFNSAF